MTTKRTRNLRKSARLWRMRASFWERVFQYSAGMKAVSAASTKRKAAGTAGGAGVAGAIATIVANKSWPAVVGAFLAGLASLSQIALDDARERQNFHLRRRVAYDRLRDEMTQRLSEDANPITDSENAAWGARIQAIRGCDYYDPTTWPADTHTKPLPTSSART